MQDVEAIPAALRIALDMETLQLAITDRHAFEHDAVLRHGGLECSDRILGRRHQHRPRILGTVKITWAWSAVRTNWSPRSLCNSRRSPASSATRRAWQDATRERRWIP